MRNDIRRGNHGKMKNRLIIIPAVVALAVLLSACGNIIEKDTGTVSIDTNETMNQQTNTYRQISMDEAVIMTQEESDYIILDVRRADEFVARHIPNAINVANEDIGTTEIAKLPDKDQLIMVYCRSGRRSKEAVEKMAVLGYTNIVEFGGILDWTGDVVTGE